MHTSASTGKNLAKPKVNISCISGQALGVWICRIILPKTADTLKISSLSRFCRLYLENLHLLTLQGTSFNESACNQLWLHILVFYTHSQ